MANIKIEKSNLDRWTGLTDRQGRNLFAFICACFLCETWENQIIVQGFPFKLIFADKSYEKGIYKSFRED